MGTRPGEQHTNETSYQEAEHHIEDCFSALECHLLLGDNGGQHVSRKHRKERRHQGCERESCYFPVFAPYAVNEDDARRSPQIIQQQALFD